MPAPRALSLYVVGCLLVSTTLAGADAAGPPSAALTAIPDLSGRWAQEQVTTTLTRVPVVGDVRSVTTTLLIVDVQQQDAELRVRSQVCSITVDNQPALVRTVLGDAFVRALPITERPAHLVQGTAGWQLQQPRFTEVIGARLGSPEREPLPTTMDDPRVVDQDNSGQGGMTVRIEGLVRGEIYVVQRGWNQLQSLRIDSGYVEGSLRWGNEQVILGASSRFLRRESDARPDPAPGTQRFRMIRIPAETSCASILRRGEGLWSR